MRKLYLNDAAELAKIHATSFPDCWSEKEFVSMLSDATFFGFREEQGFILCRKACDVIDVVTFCVTPLYRNHGIGKKLLSAVTDFAKSDGCEIFLEVAERNEVAIALYEACGFSKVSKRKNYYKSAKGIQNAILMKFSSCSGCELTETSDFISDSSFLLTK